jgi:hypothetical protein
LPGKLAVLERRQPIRQDHPLRLARLVCQSQRGLEAATESAQEVMLRARV